MANRLSARADKRVMLIAAGGGDRPLRNPHRDWEGAPDKIRTCDLCLRRAKVQVASLGISYGRSEIRWWRSSDSNLVTNQLA